MDEDREYQQWRNSLVEKLKRDELDSPQPSSRPDSSQQQKKKSVRKKKVHVEAALREPSSSSRLQPYQASKTSKGTTLRLRSNPSRSPRPKVRRHSGKGK